MAKKVHSYPQPIYVCFRLQGESFTYRYDEKQVVADEFPNEERLVEAYIQVRQDWYGPYRTDVKATKRSFSNRLYRYKELTREERKMHRSIRNWERWIVEQWAKLLDQDVRITGQLIWQQVSQSKNRTSTYSAVYGLYDALRLRPLGK